MSQCCADGVGLRQGIEDAKPGESDKFMLGKQVERSGGEGGLKKKKKKKEIDLTGSMNKSPKTQLCYLLSL